ncbi:hypothetical protein PABG_03758 [Paracoccidioides brasiliensis Pb03]|uniref:Uncharacterized protein n=1 Tax=Paracoccidioides brasiliensis (strain Pb18) TaxID=502780 RepID=C1FZM9_PARBD|nr:uncharacterized protein PADG_00069 [Paracoccidioides brasiliensis Pb18]EEH21542.2 hypothetical protein PABG_03758 [Paracoccidioides brasiliensis Pb03]EEH43780.2 hypothetical protein PADG_00069 [Paracoccidioides brasiliensis Pb18]ODH51911.1 hypothetical protein GX48_01922 [Paracoccidioides brasiliensis]
MQDGGGSPRRYFSGHVPPSAVPASSLKPPASGPKPRAPKASDNPKTKNNQRQPKKTSVREFL